MSKKVEKGYEDRYCPKCQKETYFDGNECQCCHFTFSEVELEQKQELIPRLAKGEYLCDTCMYDWRSACHRPERPNAIFCLDYQTRLSKEI